MDRILQELEIDKNNEKGARVMSIKPSYEIRSAEESGLPHLYELIRKLAERKT